MNSCIEKNKSSETIFILLHTMSSGYFLVCFVEKLTMILCFRRWRVGLWLSIPWSLGVRWHRWNCDLMKAFENLKGGGVEDEEPAVFACLRHWEPSWKKWAWVVMAVISGRPRLAAKAASGTCWEGPFLAQCHLKELEAVGGWQVPQTLSMGVRGFVGRRNLACWKVTIWPQQQ